LVSLVSITSEFDRNEESKKEESNPSARARKNTSKSLSLITRALCGVWRGFDHLGVGWLGVFIAPTTKLAVLVGLSVVWCTGQSGAHRTCPVRQPHHQGRWVPTVGALSSGPAWMSGGTPDMCCRVSGVPACACLTSARFWRALNAPAGDRWREVVVALLAHRTVR
jgi:hypothetical protein